MKKVICLLLVLVMVLAMCPAGLAAEPETGLSNFKRVNTYGAGQFTDVSSKQWYAANVQAAYELNLMQGNGNGTFGPTANISVIETIVTACRLHSIYHTGESNFVNGSPWYQPYVDYAVENGIIKASEYSNYNAPATRAQFVSILAKAFPESALPAINKITAGKIPDVPAGASYYNAAYLMYNAGILVGNDDYGTFAPDGNINRVQAAAIITRMADASLRLTKTLKVYDPYPPTGIVIQDVKTWSSTRAELRIGQSAQLDVTLTPSVAVSGITWNSSNPSVASVDEYGNVTAHKKGSATITAATYNGKKDSYEISVPYAAAQLEFALTKDGKGYEIIGCDTSAYTVHIPAAYDGLPVSSIKGGAFKKCTNLRAFTVDKEQKTFYEDDGVIFTDSPEKTLVCFPPAYDAAKYYYVPKDTVAIAPYAFAGLTTTLATLTMQEGLRQIGDYAFAESSSYAAVYVPDSLTEIGDALLQSQRSSIPFYGNAGTAFEAYAQQNQIPYGTLYAFQSDLETVETEPPASLDMSWVTLPDEKNIVLHTGVQNSTYWSYDNTRGIPPQIEQRYDLTSYQKKHTGEVRLMLEGAWSAILPDVNGNTEIDFPAQTGLYGAGHTEGEAVLRGYDRQGNLVAMQNISGNFAFSFPGACSLGVESGASTKFTVIPIEPIFISSAGNYRVDAEEWHRLNNGNIFQYFVVQLEAPVVRQKMPEYLNLFGYNFADAATGQTTSFGAIGAHYLIGSYASRDASRAEQLEVVSLTFAGNEILWNDENLLCMVDSELNQAKEFGQKTSELLKKVKQTMIGAYVPTSITPQKIRIDSSAGSGSSVASFGNIKLSEDAIKEFNERTIAHEMVHAIDQNIATICYGPYAPSPWMEGRAEYISDIALGGSGERGEYDWSFLSEEDKADFFHYYYYSTNRYTAYDVGHYFFCYILKTYGEGVSIEIMESIAALPEVDIRYTIISDEMQEEYAQMFKQCVEAATEVGVFQNFVRDVIEK